MIETEGGWTALRSTTCQFVDLLERGFPGPGKASSLTTGFYSPFELIAPVNERNSTTPFILCSPYSDALGMPQGAYLDFPRSTEWEAAVDRFHTLSTVFGIRPQESLLSCLGSETVGLTADLTSTHT